VRPASRPGASRPTVRNPLTRTLTLTLTLTLALALTPTLPPTLSPTLTLTRHARLHARGALDQVSSARCAECTTCDLIPRWRTLVNIVLRSEGCSEAVLARTRRSFKLRSQLSVNVIQCRTVWPRQEIPEVLWEIRRCHSFCISRKMLIRDIALSGGD
jgi:hypothetical protein